MYSAKINGEPTTFGTSGLLYRSNKLMYDRATNSLWSQLLGEPVIGPLADSGIELSFFPVLLTTWGEWLAEHPDTTVLSRETGYYLPRQYQPEDDPNSIYFDYRATSETMFPIWQRDTPLDTKEEVLGLSWGDTHKAYPVGVLRQERVVNDEVGDIQVVIVASSESTGARVYARKGQTFGLPEGNTARPGLPTSLVDADGVQWRVTEDALINTADSSQTLPRLPSHLSFWFGWFAFHPDTLVYGLD